MRRALLLAGFCLLLAGPVRAEDFETWPGATYQPADKFWFRQNLKSPSSPVSWAVSGSSAVMSVDAASPADSFQVLYATGICPNVYGTWHIPFTMSTNSIRGDIGVFIGREPYEYAGSDPNSAVWFDYDVTHDMAVRTEAGPGGVAHYCSTDFATSINIRDGSTHTVHLDVSASDITFMIDSSTEVCSAATMGVGPYSGTPTMLAVGFYVSGTTGTATDKLGDITWERDESASACPGNRFTLFKPGAAGVDNALLSNTPTTNLGTNEALVSRSDSNHRSVIEFDLSGLDPGDTCVAATLTLTTRSNGAGGAHNVSALKAANDGWTELGSTWNTKDGSNAWAGSAGASTSGTDFNATPLGTFTASTTELVDNAIALDCDQVELWFGNAANYGLVLWNTAGVGDQFFSSDYSNPAYRPQLVIEWSTPSGDDDDAWGTWTNGLLWRRFQ